MSVQLTDDSRVALFDSVTGIAFGPTFSSREHAEDFLSWYSSRSFAVTDPRALRPATLKLIISEWARERLDRDGDLLEAVEV